MTKPKKPKELPWGGTEYYRAKDGWRWREWSQNGRVLADSGEAYGRLYDARIGHSRVVDKATADEVVRKAA